LEKLVEISEAECECEECAECEGDGCEFCTTGPIPPDAEPECEQCKDTGEQPIQVEWVPEIKWSTQPCHCPKGREVEE
ncbi:hypothetical protein KAR91_16160, partial [Candidatus Pacearchaeota archaeon]|nr:hypothetical protein [Candidatus Pacearchaeota archaeon]